MKNNRYKQIVTWILLLFPMMVHAQLLVTPANELPGWNADDLVRNIFLNSGVQVSNVKFNGSLDTIFCNSIGIFETGTTPTNLGIESGIIIATGKVNVAAGQNNNSGYSINPNCEYNDDPSLLSIATGEIHHGAVLEFDFVPYDSIIKFNYVFGSEEYPEYVGSLYNDVFGFFVWGPNPSGGDYNGQNVAIIPNTNEVVSINNVNLNHNSEYYVDNTDGTTIQFDGFTTVMEVRFNVAPMQIYHLKMAICDVGDGSRDSGVFLESNSLSTNAAILLVDDQPSIEHPDGFDVCKNDSVYFNVTHTFNPSNIVWSFGDGGTGNGLPATHLYTTIGDYDVTCNIYEQDSLVKTLTTVLHVHDVYQIEIWRDTCDFYTYMGQTFTESCNHDFYGQTIYGCDSITTLHLAIHHSDTTILIDTVCDYYNWYGTTYTESGVYEHLEHNFDRCDSLIILHLTVYYNDTIIESQAEACDSYFWDVSGSTYTQSGTYDYTVTTSQGCSHQEILHLTIYHSETEDFYVTACDSIIWHGTWYYTPDNYTFDTITAQGCERIETLHLTVSHGETEEFNITECDSIIWHGTKYDTSGDYTFDTITAEGCERKERLHLTINQSETEEFDVNDCDSIIWHGTRYNTSGDYTFDTMTIEGCPRIEILHLTLGQSYAANLNETVCDFYPWVSAPDGFLTQSGSYTFTGYNVDGCDSIVNLDLIVNHTPKLEIHGFTEVAISTDLWPGIYNYCLADSAELHGCDIQWSCSNPNWILIPATDPVWCRLIAKSLGQATLTAVSDCGYGCDTICSLDINASHFDVDENEAQTILLFPNPTHGQVFIQAPQLRQVKFYNSFGMVAKDLYFESTDIVSIDISDLAQGLYIVEIITTQGKASKKLFVLE
ncbi:MAG: choice-of-anchor L domain-containing protein [Bacteroidales bacterium]|nr:choice-of-anchor L domain-containing protein [Bacteroidales bacterium]